MPGTPRSSKQRYRLARAGADFLKSIEAKSWMAKIDITRTELVWPGKYHEDGTLKEVPRVSLPALAVCGFG